MSFMKPHVYKGDYYLVETSNGTEFIPGDMLSIDMAVGESIDDDRDAQDWADCVKLVRDFVSDEVESIERGEGYYGRYSAPGYMDATDWTWGETEAEVMAELERMYGDGE